MSDLEKINVVDSVKNAAPFFEISIRLSVFGHVIFERTWPPKKS